MDIIYNKIIERIKSKAILFEDHGLPMIRHFDVFKNQYIYPELHQLYAMPALFYQYRVGYTDEPNLKQKAIYTITIHIELENYGESFDGSQTKDYALQIFSYHGLIGAILHGFGTEFFSPLKRRSGDPDENPTNSNVFKLSFDTEVSDDTALQVRLMDTEDVELEDMTITKVPANNLESEESKYII